MRGLHVLTTALVILAVGCSSVETTPTAAPTPVPSATATATPVPNFSDAGIDVSDVPFTGSVASSAVAVAPDGSVVAAVNPDSDSVTLVDTVSLAVLDEVPVGDDPRTLAFTPDSRYVLVANRASAELSIVDVALRQQRAIVPLGPMPYGVVTDGRYAYVAESALAKVRAIALSKGEATGVASLSDFPMGLTLHVPSDGRNPLLLVTHFFNGKVTALNPVTLATLGTASTGHDVNLTQHLVIAPDGRRAYLPQTRFNTTNPALTFDTTVFPVVNVLNLDDLSLLRAERVTIDTADRPVAIPFAAVVSPGGGRLSVVNAGSDNLTVVDLETNTGIGSIDVGASPRGVTANRDGSRLFVNNVLDGTLTVVDAVSLDIIDTVPLTTIPLEPQILLGKRIFNSAEAPMLSTDRWIACATCHFDGSMDARTWLSFPDGPRNTPALFGVADTAPFHWSGDLNELQDVENTIRDIQAGTGLAPGDARDSLGPPHTGLSPELDALAAFMASLTVPASPYTDGMDMVERGQAVFASLQCDSCHVPPFYVNAALHDVGTGDPATERNSHGHGTSFDTPSLLGIWHTAPYFHDGTAENLEAVFTIGTVHNIAGATSPGDLNDLVAFLLSLPVEER